MQAPVEKRIIQQCMREGQALPRKIAGAPELDLGLALYYDAFFELTSDRRDNGPIPWSSIHAYALALGLDDEQADDLFAHIRAMDKAYLDWSDSKTESSK